MQTPISDTDKIENAFEKLRGLGYIARGGPNGFLCCQNCAGTKIASDVNALSPDERAKVRGAVFYHEQDAEAFTDGGTLYIAYGPVSCEAGEFGESIKAVGEALASALREAGLNVKWDGDPDTRIGIYLGAYAPPRRIRDEEEEDEDSPWYEN